MTTMARSDESAFVGPATEVSGIPTTASASRVVALWSGGHAACDLPSSGTLVLGRSPDADLVLDHPSVSRKHATLVVDGRRGGTLTLEDHGSSNGTFVDGQKLESGGSAAIRPGSVIELGAVMVVVHAPAGSSADAPDAEPPSLVLADPAMDEVFRLVEVVAKSKLTVLFIGETGVGKEVLASRVHAASSRAEKPFLKINCAALVESLLESELFGHERGAFTGAVQTKVGLVENANGGTLFLDEVGELSLATQAKLLRLLEDGAVTRVGGARPIPVDVRFVCATNRSLKAMVEDGTFRRDLYFRLDGLTILVPPLRERRSAIEPLAQRFLLEASESSGERVKALSREAVLRLVAHSWPGNVRELKNVIARSVLFCKGDTLLESDLRIEAEHPFTEALEPGNPGASVDSAKKRRVLDALEKSKWNQTRAAALLGVSRRTLHNWLVELDIPRARATKDPA